MLVQCFPDASVRSKVLAMAEEEGVSAFENGCFIRFAQPEDINGMAKLTRVINYGKLMATAPGEEPGGNAAPLAPGVIP